MLPCLLYALLFLFPSLTVPHRQSLGVEVMPRSDHRPATTLVADSRLPLLLSLRCLGETTKRTAGSGRQWPALMVQPRSPAPPLSPPLPPLPPPCRETWRTALGTPAQCRGLANVGGLVETEFEVFSCGLTLCRPMHDDALERQAQAQYLHDKKRL